MEARTIELTRKPAFAQTLRRAVSKESETAAKCYRAGNEALQRKNFDYAAKMYQQCARLVPENVLYRQMARGAAGKMYGENKTGASSLAKMKIGGLRSKAKKLRGKKDFAEASALLEEALSLNPWDVQSNVDLAELAEEAEWMEVAQHAMTCARNSDPNNKELNIALAGVLANRDQFDEAAKLWEHVAKLDPDDGHARTMVQRMYTEATRHKGRFDEADKATELKVSGEMSPEEVNRRLGTSGKPGEADGPGMSERADLERDTRKNPKSVEAWQKLGAYLKRQKDFAAAMEAFGEALKLDPDNSAVQEQHEDCEIAILKAELSNSRDAGDEEAVREAAKNLIKREMQVLETRVQRYPQDLSIKYELGSRFVKTNNAKLIPKAIPLLQKATQSPQHKGKALMLLGQCFIKEKKPSLAKGQLERALPELHPENDEAMVIEAHYLLARIYEQLSDVEKAESHYGDVLVLDYEYKDAKDRLEKIQAG